MKRATEPRVVRGLILERAADMPGTSPPHHHRSPSHQVTWQRFKNVPQSAGMHSLPHHHRSPSHQGTEIQEHSSECWHAFPRAGETQAGAVLARRDLTVRGCLELEDQESKLYFHPWQSKNGSLLWTNYGLHGRDTAWSRLEGTLPRRTV